MGLTLINPPAQSVISLAEAKAHLVEDSDDNDSLIGALVDAATEYCNGPGGFLGRALVDQTWQLTIDKFPTAEIKIPLPPLQQISSIKYDDASGTEQTLDPSKYTVDRYSEPGWVFPVGSWPATFSGVNAVRIQFVAGYGYNADSPPINKVPSDIKAAIKLILTALYENRSNIIVGQAVSTIPFSAEVLLRRKRFDLSMA